jgi:hypothetical protein
MDRPLRLRVNQLISAARTVLCGTSYSGRHPRFRFCFHSPHENTPVRFACVHFVARLDRGFDRRAHHPKAAMFDLAQVRLLDGPSKWAQELDR